MSCSANGCKTSEAAASAAGAPTMTGVAAPPITRILELKEYEYLYSPRTGQAEYGIRKPDGNYVPFALVAGGKAYLDFYFAGLGEKPLSVKQQLARLKRIARNHPDVIRFLETVQVNSGGEIKLPSAQANIRPISGNAGLTPPPPSATA